MDTVFGIPAENIPLIIGLVVLAGVLLFLPAVLDRRVLECRSEKSALKALKRVSEWDYRALREIEEKSKFPAVRQAAHDKNAAGLAVRRAVLSRSAQRAIELPYEPCCRGSVTEPGTLAVCKLIGYGAPGTPGGKTCYFDQVVTAALPGKLAAFSPKNAEYVLFLRSRSELVGTYTDGTAGYQDKLEGELVCRADGSTVRQFVDTGGMPAERKFHNRRMQGEMADPTQMILDACRKVVKMSK